MRILFLSLSLPPFAESQTIRNVYLVRGLVEAGHEVVLVSGPGVGGDSTLDKALPYVEVFRTGRVFYDFVQERIGRIAPPSLKSRIRSLFAIGMGMVTVPDVRLDWASKAYRVARPLLRGVDVIVSSAGSFTAHMAAARLAKETRIPWVAEYGDPWAINPIRPASFPHIRAVNSAIERRALSHCSALTVTTEATAGAYAEWLGRSTPPITVVPCGFDPEDFEASCSESRLAKPIVLSYIGTASRRGRDLTPVLEALARVRESNPAVAARIELRVIGSVPHTLKERAGQLKLDRVQFTGPVSYSDSVCAIKNSDILLLVGNTGTMQVPLKAFMYLGSGRTIIYMGQIPQADDPTWAIVREFDGVTYTRKDPAEIAQGLIGIVKDFEVTSRSSKLRRQDPRLVQYSWPAVGRKFADVVAKTAGERLSLMPIA